MTYLSFRSQSNAGFNRYMVECESLVVGVFLERWVVLIDTWWNVNMKSLTEKQYFLIVLIDTWWNVNAYDFVVVSVPEFVLIDTWWNVNINALPVCGL